MFAEIYPHLGLTRSGAAGRRCAEPCFLPLSRSTAARREAFPWLPAALRLLGGHVWPQRRLCFPWPCRTEPGVASPGEEDFGARRRALGNGSAGLNAEKRRLWVRCGSV